MHQFAALILSDDVTDSESAALQLLMLQFLFFFYITITILCVQYKFYIMQRLFN